MAINFLIDVISCECGKDLLIEHEMVAGKPFCWSLEITGDDRVPGTVFTIDTFGTDLFEGLDENELKIKTVTGDDPVKLLLKSKPSGFPTAGQAQISIIRADNLVNMAVIKVNVKASTGTPTGSGRTTVPPASPVPPATPVPPSSSSRPRPPPSPSAGSASAPKPATTTTGAPETKKRKTPTAAPTAPAADPKPTEERVFTPSFVRKLIVAGIAVVLISILLCTGTLTLFGYKSVSWTADKISPEETTSVETPTPAPETAPAPADVPPETDSTSTKPRVIKGRSS